MTPERHEEICDTLLRGMKSAVAEAVEVHRRLGQPIVGSRDGRIVWRRPEEIDPRALPHDHAANGHAEEVAHEATLLAPAST